MNIKKIHYFVEFPDDIPVGSIYFKIVECLDCNKVMGIETAFIIEIETNFQMLI